jgi:hypothetical protein
MTLVPKLEMELVEAARRARGTTPARRRPRATLLVLAIIGVLVLAAVGIAAGGLLDNGKPVKPPGHQAPKPHEGFGVIKPGSARVLPVAVPDPAGGPAWSLRYVATTRGVGCLQAGRLMGGQLGVLGQDGAFGNDGRFHPFVPDYLGFNYGGPYPCGLLDAHGHAFAAVSMNGVPASGLLVPSSTNKGCVAHRDHGPIGKRPNQPQICPRDDWRQLYFGMAGPEAKSVTYTAGGSEHTVQTVGEQGAYLIVLPASLKRDHNRYFGGWSPLSGAGGGPIVRVDYRNGDVCHLHPGEVDTGQSVCPRVGEAPVPRPHLTSADVAAPIKTSLHRASYGPQVVASFVARVPITDASTEYGGFFRLTGSGVNCNGGQGGGSQKDIAVGERVYFRFPTQGCHGRFHGIITYQYMDSPDASAIPFPGPDTLVVGRFTVNVP